MRKFVFIAKDVSEKKVLELKLKESETKYRDLFENAEDPMYTHDLKGYLLAVNKIGFKILGGTEEDVIGSHISKWLTPESYCIFEERVKKIHSGEPLEEPVLIEVICKNGEHKWGEVRTRLIRNGDSIVGTHGIVRDITEKKRLEEKIEEYQEQLEKSYEETKESEARYRELFENAIDAIYTQDLEGRILTMNSAGLKILGCTRDELIGTNFSEWLTSESLKIGRGVLAKTLSGKIIKKPTVVEIIRKSGEHRWVEFTIRPIKENDRIIRIHGIGRDVTENKRLRQELKDSNKQIKLLWYLMTETRGGNTRALILKHLTDKPYNANQLAGALGMDYKTIRHHLSILVKNGIVRKEAEGYSSIYFLPKVIRANLDNLNQIK